MVALAILGVAELAVKLSGPDQLYVPPPVAVKFKVLPAHIGLFELAVAVGRAFTVAVVEAVAVQPAALVTVTV